MARRRDVSTFCETPLMERRSSPKRLVPVRRSRTISTSHLLPMGVSVVSMGQEGRDASLSASAVSVMASSGTAVGICR